MTHAIDMSPDANLDRVGRLASDLGYRIRDEEPRRLFDELVLLCRYHPAKAAQLLMCLAAWFDVDEDTSVLVERARAVTESRVTAVLQKPSSGAVAS
jgi:tRNA isopentenyl-2-thiomethyl-A-37 hydroxylase MiaE